MTDRRNKKHSRNCDIGRDANSVLNKKLKKILKDHDEDSIVYKMLICCYKEKFLLFNLTGSGEEIMREFMNIPDKSKLGKLKIDILNRIRIMSIDKNNLSILPDLRSFTKLKILDISDNKLTRIPKMNDIIKELDIRNNKITTVPLLTNLRILEASKNKIVKLNLSSKIERLDISYNPITSIESIPTLKYLNISNTNFSSFNYELPSLSYLDMSNTSIKRIECNDNEIEYLCASNSKLTYLPNMEYVREINIQNTRVKRIPFYDSLEKLSMNVDQINKIKLPKQYKIKDVCKHVENNLVIFEFETQFER